MRMGERNDSSGARYFARLSESSLTNYASPNALVNPRKRSSNHFEAQSALRMRRLGHGKVLNKTVGRVAL